LYPLLFIFFLFFYCSVTHRYLHSFPTRRSSDLKFSFSSNSGWPESTICSNFSVDVSKFVSSRISSSTGNVRFWASSMINTAVSRSEEHTSELQSQSNLVCRLLLEKKKKKK